MLLSEICKFLIPPGAARNQLNVRLAGLVSRVEQQIDELGQRALFGVAHLLDLLGLAAGQEEGDRELTPLGDRLLDHAA